MKQITGRVVAVHRSPTHTFGKITHDEVMLLAGLGVEGDAHMGTTVKHRSRVAKDPSQPNLRQVHLVRRELHEDLAAKGYDIAPGEMGENITTEGIAIDDLPVGTVLSLGADARIELTGLRNPCPQLNDLGTGLLKELVFNGEASGMVRLAGVMSVVRDGGVVRPGDTITAQLPPEPHTRMTRI